MKFLSAALCLLATTLTVESAAGPSLRLRYTNKNPPPLQTYSAHLHNDPEGAYSPVYGGVTAEDIAEAPFQAALFANGAFFCSGGIIAKDWVITAGHCVDATAKGDVDVQVGSIRLAPEAADTSVQKVTTSAADRILHPDFNMDFLDNDIALIKLPQDLKLTPSVVQALRLPTYADTTNKLIDTKVQISGWGRVSDDGAGPSVSPVLQIAYIKITDDKECENIYGNAMIGTKICATTMDEGVSTCSGDSGGAVVEFLRGKFVVHGITSFGSNRGCTIGRPVVFTRVSSFLEFIETTTGLPVSD